jgi:GT2 family glycosyltransferase
MATIGLIVPIYKNFEGFAELMYSVDVPVLPIVINNWINNIGVSAGWNEGIKRSIDSGCDLALICNDDITLEPGTINKLADSIYDHHSDLITPVNTRDGQVTDQAQYHQSPDFACFMIRPGQFVQKFGWFDTNFFPAYFEDNDMAYRIKLAGGSYCNRTDAGMFHKGSVTQNWGGQQVVTGQMFRANETYYISKWGGRPGQEKFTTPFGE